MNNIIRPLIFILMMTFPLGCSQNVINIRGSSDRSMDVFFKMTPHEEGNEIVTEVHFGTGTGDIDFGPNPGDG